MQRFILGLTACLFLTPLVASGASFNSEKYVDASVKDLTQFTAYYNSIDLNDPDVFREYLKVNECKAYNEIKNNQFELQKIKEAFQQRIAGKKREDTELFFRIPMVLQVTGYNFDTQSLSILAASQLNKINMLELIPNKIEICEKETNLTLVSIPAFYNVKLNLPISLLRVPLQRDVAEGISSRLERDFSHPEYMLVFSYIFVSIEAIQPETKKVLKYTAATLRGQVDAIDIYSDRDRKVLLKRLDYKDSL